MAGVDDLIRRWVEDVEDSGELKRNKYIGQPLPRNDAFAETPAERR